MFSVSMPLLVIPAGYPRRIAHVPPNFNSTLTMAHVAKHAEPITSGKEIENIMRRAFSLLRNGRGSPVIIEFPAEANGEDAPDPLTYEPVIATKYGPDPAAVKAAAKVLVAAKRPVLYAGHGVHWAEAYDELKELAELLAETVHRTFEVARPVASDELQTVAQTFAQYLERDMTSLQAQLQRNDDAMTR